MKYLRRAPLADTIFNRTLLLVLATVLLLTAVNIAIIFLRAPPMSAPLTAYEVARVLDQKPIAKPTADLIQKSVSAPPTLRRSGEHDIFAAAVAGFLHVSPTDVHIQREMGGPFGANADRMAKRESALYSSDGAFNPLVFGRFTIAVRRPTGEWRVVSSPGRNSLEIWQTQTVLRFVLSLLVVIPIAWIFSSRIAKPIRGFAQAAERLGRRRQAEPVEVVGPIEIRQAALAINDMQQRLQTYLAERSSMVGAIAHDLRTPLTRLRFLLAPAPDELRTTAEAEVAEMEALIAAILDFVQSEGRARAHDSVDLGLLVEGIVDDFADMGHDVKLEKSSAVTIHGDAALLKRLFANLISNALNYGKLARISMQVVNDEAIVDVEDEGPGLSEGELERVFLPFYRTESSRNRATGGMGLGLAIVKAVAETHGVNVELFNRATGGLCARIVLPIVKGD